MRTSFPPQTATIIMPADVVMRAVYRSPRTNQEYYIEDLIEENLNLKQALNFEREINKKLDARLKKHEARFDSRI